jgi:hypothetical protein
MRLVHRYSLAIREKYAAHVARMLRLVGGEYADEAAAAAAAQLVLGRGLH